VATGTVGAEYQLCVLVWDGHRLRLLPVPGVDAVAHHRGQRHLGNGAPGRPAGAAPAGVRVPLDDEMVYFDARLSARER
jgi:hypothetical protein